MNPQQKELILLLVKSLNLKMEVVKDGKISYWVWDYELDKIKQKI